VAGRIWFAGDCIDTDVIMPMEAVLAPRARQVEIAFRAIWPGWGEDVGVGDIIVAGPSFGVGSSRPAARVIRDAGVAAVIASSFNRLFLRNAVAYGLPCLTVDNARSELKDLMEATLDLVQWTVSDQETGRVWPAVKLPSQLRELMIGGGIESRLVAGGFIAGDETLQETAART
jgi:3-isopropylmalate/(R)-2-methylmalate dehydratase small subunit